MTDLCPHCGQPMPAPPDYAPDDRWLMSDEQVDESIEANEYEFTVEGRIA